jgi:glycine oxidase
MAGQKAQGPRAQGPSIAIAGAGVCGLAIAWRLARAGCSVTVYDKDEAGRGATWAAAGMLAAGVEAEPGEEGLWRLNRASQGLWPAFRAELEAASGMTLGYREEGTLVVALTRDDLEQLRFSHDFQSRLGVRLEWLTAAQARRREPQLRPGVAGALYSPDDHQVDNRKLALALKEAAVRAGVALHEGQAVEALDCEGGRVRGLLVAGERVAADAVVLATGAHAREMAGLPEGLRPPVRPLKGQMLSLRMDPRFPLIEHVVWAPKLYLVPRGDGRLLIGATVEEKGFDAQLTAGGVLSLLEGAWRAFPAIEELEIEEFWVGHRPTSRDDAPILGPVEGLAGLYLATGHHRNGILLAPMTAEAVSSAILQGKMPREAEAFTLARFSGKERRRA